MPSEIPACTVPVRMAGWLGGAGGILPTVLKPCAREVPPLPPEARFRLDGRVAWLPGGAGGIGATLARAFASAGAAVVISSRGAERCEALAASIRAGGGDALAAAGDMTVAADVATAAAAADAAFGRLDILVQCVGGNARHGAEAYPEDDWDRIIALNLKTTYLTCRAAARAMIPRGYGRILTISSVRSLLGIASGYSAYCAAKAAVNGLTRQLATEWARHGITVNALAPTFIRTAQVADLLGDPGFAAALVARIPLGRVGEPEDLVGPALLLCSDAAGFVTGQVLGIDGGLTACQ